MELSRIAGSFSPEISEGTSSESSNDSEEFSSATPTVTLRVTIKQATGLPPSLSNFVFCQYSVWGHSEPVVVPPVVNPNPQNHTDSTVVFKFEHSRDFTIPVTEEFAEHCAEGALSIEVLGHRSPGFSSRAKPGWEVEQRQLAKARSLADRWSELTRKIELWVEILELNDQGEYTPVEVLAREDMLTGGIYQLRQGQQRRIQVCHHLEIVFIN